MARRGRKRKDVTHVDDATDIHIIMQIKSAADLDYDKKLVFKNGDEVYITKEIAADLLQYYESLKPEDKQAWQWYVFESMRNFLDEVRLLTT